MQLNPKIKEICEEHGVIADSAYIVLLYLYFQLSDDIFEDIYHREIQSLDFLGIIKRNYDDHNTEFLISLFVTNEEENEWNWVLDLRKLFTNVRRDAGGTPNACITKMQKFFAIHPNVRSQDCMDAAKMYISTVNDPKYLQRCDYFISKMVNKNEKNSRLEEYLEIIKTNKNQELKINL